VNPLPAVDGDAAQAAVAMAAQRVAAFCDQRRIAIDPALCEELAEMVITDYRTFITGVRFGRTHTPAPPKPDPNTAGPGRASAEPGQ